MWASIVPLLFSSQAWGPMKFLTHTKRRSPRQRAEIVFCIMRATPCFSDHGHKFVCVAVDGSKVIIAQPTGKAINSHVSSILPNTPTLSFGRRRVCAFSASPKPVTPRPPHQTPPSPTGILPFVGLVFQLFENEFRQADFFPCAR